MVGLDGAERCVPYRSWTEIMNIGDCLTPHIIENSFHCRAIAAPEHEQHVLGIGSIFFMANENSHIWGSGVLSDWRPIPNFDAKKITALRGIRTADHLTRCGYHVPDVPFGDPAVLVPDLFAPQATPPSAACSEIVFIPHHTNYTNWKTSRFADSGEIDLLDPCTSSLDFIERVRGADVVISESLHGLIFASALGRKVTWIANENADLFKYYDWFSTVDRAPPTPMNPWLPIDELAAAAELVPHNIKVGDLKASFPGGLSFDLPTQGRVDFRAARDHNPFCFFFQDPHWPLRTSTMPATRFFDLAAAVADNIFFNWDERPYAVAIDHTRGVLPRRQQLAKIVCEMDHYMSHHFAVIATRAQVAAAGLEMHPLGDGVSWAYGPFDDVGAVIIRPPGRRLGEDYVVFCI